MKLTLKLILVLSFLSSIALADEGDMTGGGRSCPQGQQTCLTGDTPDTEPTDEDTNDTEDEDSLLAAIQKYLSSIFE